MAGRRGAARLVWPDRGEDTAIGSILQYWQARVDFRALFIDSLHQQPL